MQLAGFGILCVALPLLRDLAIVRHPASALVAAALGYGTLLLAVLITVGRRGVSISGIGFGAPSVRSVVLGLVAGILVVAPVWHLPAVDGSRLAWVLIAVVNEEIVFRGVLFALLRRAGGLPLAIAGSAAAFTLAHAASAAWTSLALVALAGLFLGLLRAIRGDLWTPGLAHFVMDLVSLP